MNLKEESEQITLIDPEALDKECVNLPNQYRRWAFLSAEAKRDIAEAKAALDVVEADLALKIREKPSNYGLDKVTEAALKNIITAHGDFQQAQAAVHKVQYKGDMCQSVVWALEHKKRCLTNLVSLYGAGWNAEVRLDEEGRAALKKKETDRLNARLKQKNTKS